MEKLLEDRAFRMREALVGTTVDELKTWFDEGVKQKATHMIVVCDTFDYEDYPVYVTSKQDVHKVAKEHSENMQKVMEVYDLRKNKDEQFAVVNGSRVRVLNY
jgi:hypothetical protein